MAVVCKSAAVAPVRPLAWEPPQATGMAPHTKKKKKENGEKKKKERKGMRGVSATVKWVKDLVLL